MRAITQALTNLTGYDGRDDWLDFWKYSIPAAFVSVSVSNAVATRLFGGASAAEDLPTHTAVTDLVGYRCILLVVVSVLLSASVARRLRDVGLSPLWGLLPIVPFVTGIIALAGLGGDIATRRFADRANIVAMLALVALLIMLALPSKGRGTGPSKSQPVDGPWVLEAGTAPPSRAKRGFKPPPPPPPRSRRD